jgi:predicted nucleotidyltransferase
MDDLLRAKRDQIIRIAAAHGAGNLRVFGSAARGNARPDSDVDLLIDITGEPSPWFPGGLISDLEELLGRRVDVATERELHEVVRARVVKEAVPL